MNVNYLRKSLRFLLDSADLAATRGCSVTVRHRPYRQLRRVNDANGVRHYPWIAAASSNGRPLTVRLGVHCEHTTTKPSAAALIASLAADSQNLNLEENKRMLINIITFL